MLAMASEGMYCVWPREKYVPGDLPAEYHPAVVAYFERAAYRFFLPEARTKIERAGMKERASEAASVAYMKWLELRTDRKPRGVHASAMAGIRRYMEKSRWQGFTGARRQANRATTEGMLARKERIRERAAYTPAMVAEAIERIGRSPALGRKAYRLAKRIGLPGVRELVREACGFAAE